MEAWAEVFQRDPVACPDHILISLMAWHLIPEPLADGIFDHPTCLAWRASEEFRDVYFSDYLIAQGTSIERVLDEVRRSRRGR